jgi:phosphoribosylformylglycinamidine cyclo-ligase
MGEKLTYKESGVDYDSMDPFKKTAQLAAQKTNLNALHLGFQPLSWTRGESVYVTEKDGRFFGHVEEGLGTKNLVADAMHQLTGKTYYDHIGQDTLAMIVNDMITLGILPVTVAMHLAVGSSDWFNNTDRSNDLINGWKKACDISECIWGGGETPTLKDIIVPGTSVISGSAFGASVGDIIFDPINISAGDAIIFCQSSGIHANGLTLARKIAETLPNGYLTELPGGRSYGETLLDPTHIYVPFIKDCIDEGIDVHYAVNVTGHGLRKLMRSHGNFNYLVNKLPERSPIFDFIRKAGNIDLSELYGNFNMGAGFAVYVSDYDAKNILTKMTGKYPFSIIKGGEIQESDKKMVTIDTDEAAVDFYADELNVR